MNTGRRSRSILRRLVRAAALVIGGWAAAVAVLTLVYAVAPPVSTLMLARWLTLRPVEREAVSLDEVSPHVVRAVLTSEDARYCLHNGVDWGALQDVIDDEGGPRRGASTIPMQVAKNLFLWPSRSYVRKGLELPIALFIDGVWTKRRLLQNYLNVAEWGDGVFGVEAASRRYFRKSAKDLSRREAALLATALPNPFRRNPARPSAGHSRITAHLLGRMAGEGTPLGCVRG